MQTKKTLWEMAQDAGMARELQYTPITRESVMEVCLRYIEHLKTVQEIPSVTYHEEDNPPEAIARGEMTFRFVPPPTIEYRVKIDPKYLDALLDPDLAFVQKAQNP